MLDKDSEAAVIPAVVQKVLHRRDPMASTPSLRTIPEWVSFKHASYIH
jgi:hypothetical protein